MSYYKTCPHCGSNLDPGERCDCQAAPAAPITDEKLEMIRILCEFPELAEMLKGKTPTVCQR